jgi:hypothetical protein
MLLCEQSSITFRRPCPQAVVQAGHVDDSIVHLHNDRRYRRLLCDLYLIDGTASFRPVVPQLVLSLPICPTSSLNEMLIVQPLRSLGRKVEVLLGGRDVLEAR